jgi:RimJ/RimL family protein N-acetyltransferase
MACLLIRPQDVRVRPLQAADFDALHALLSDPATQAANPLGPVASRQATEYLFWRWRLQQQVWGEGVGAVVSRHHPEVLLGLAGKLPQPDGAALLYVLIDAAYRERGVGRAAAEAVLNDDVPMRARPHAADRATARWLAGLGFQHTGERVDVPGLAPRTVWLRPARLAWRDVA